MLESGIGGSGGLRKGAKALGCLLGLRVLTVILLESEEKHINKTTWVQFRWIMGLCQELLVFSAESLGQCRAGRREATGARGWAGLRRELQEALLRTPALQEG